MKIAICSDVHWSQYSSIIRRRGEKYSVRLENQIKSMNWFYKLANTTDCFCAFILGDFFDKPELNSEEISALKEVSWNTVQTYFIAGNHEMGAANHKYSSSKLFSLLDVSYVYSEPTILTLDNVDFYILPYILESDRKPITEYFTKKYNNKTVILSHNDIAGIQMGKFVSETGFSISELEDVCDLCINGHLHNGTKISDKIINIGNLTGQNFSEDAFMYDHCAFILDTDTLKVEVYENPYAFNFYKLDYTKNDINLNCLKNNSIVTVKCYTTDVETIKQELNKYDNIIENHFVIQPVLAEQACSTIEELTVDHLSTFKKYIIDTFENSKELQEELEEVCR